jgi:orotate phosphoribosyltransferase-like protein
MAKPVIWIDDMVKAIPVLRDQGLGVDQIAEKLGVDRATFRKFRRKAGIKLKPINGRKRDV